jgi:hypothetical protein
VAGPFYYTHSGTSGSKGETRPCCTTVNVGCNCFTASKANYTVVQQTSAAPCHVHKTVRLEGMDGCMNTDSANMLAVSIRGT